MLVYLFITYPSGVAPWEFYVPRREKKVILYEFKVYQTYECIFNPKKKNLGLWN